MELLNNTIDYTTQIAGGKKFTENIVTKTESSKSTDISPKGAYGRWQVTQPALEDFNKDNKKEYILESMSDEQNEEVGSWYYNTKIPQMLEAQGTPVTEVNKLISYNAGASRAKDYTKLPQETMNYLIKAYSADIPNVDVKNGVNVFSEKRQDAKNMQIFLKEKGYYKGKIDNKFGPKSKAAFIKWIESLQKENE